MSEKIDKHFVSPIDIFLTKLRAEIPESATQLAERKQYQKIAKLRDYPNKKEEDEKIWHDF